MPTSLIFKRIGQHAVRYQHQHVPFFVNSENLSPDLSLFMNIVFWIKPLKK
ncbi:hypothetical protein D083_3758 [Dickeya solani RNS 08.23.3.1.A]|nr:hypothetical protein D083_3758 [Dickeya solani RNS 08.23.3.1.A]